MNTENQNPETSGATPSAEPTGAAPSPQPPASPRPRRPRRPAPSSSRSRPRSSRSSRWSSTRSTRTRRSSCASSSPTRPTRSTRRASSRSREGRRRAGRRAGIGITLDDDGPHAHHRGQRHRHDPRRGRSQNLGTIASCGSLEFLKPTPRPQKDKDDGAAAHRPVRRRLLRGVHGRRRASTCRPVDAAGRRAGALALDRARARSPSPPGEREHPGHRDRPPPQGGRERVREGLAGQGDHPQVLRLRPVSRSTWTTSWPIAPRPLWALPKAQVTDEQHAEFYQHVTGGDEGETPLLTIHFSVDAPVQFHALLYVPEKAPVDLFEQGAQRPPPLRQARPHRGGLRQAHPGRTCASCAASSTPRTSRSTSRARCCKRTGRSSQIEQQLTKQVLKSLKELAETRAREVREASGASSARSSRRASRSTGRTRTRSPSSAASSR